ncbi:recombinase family protein [Ligilactobacillus ceti]|uniref:Resolvase, N-terminal domain protein n=1 Tax=Ligilactobacillus ceti DSM 22408 TaxID=1122146 RepID=A0A0R2KHD2_9LACO|nr:recombinase family protein [Ligilactobacillus ceti]KRN88683.1 resolvase, N-terminal domain protein [Ligilactobacillus ceti DSM 22408]
MEKEIIKIKTPTYKKKHKKLKVAAYARVSTDKEEQHTSLVAQKEYYKSYIRLNPQWEYVGLFVDDGISGTSYKNRDGFNQMIDKAIRGEIDHIVTKSISRFARNTVDTINIIRLLKSKNISVFFEKENINTLDSKGEFLLTIMSSFAQEESRSISENCTWGQRKRFRDGKASVAFTNFLGYDKGENGEFVINKEEAEVVEAIYAMKIIGYSLSKIKETLEKNNILSAGKKESWYLQPLINILMNEKYIGDALLQKYYTVDFLTKKQKRNEGELPKYYVENNHKGIIPREVQEYVISCMEENKEKYPTKLACKECGAYLGRFRIHAEFKGGSWGWRCRNRYSKIKKCHLRHIYDREYVKSLQKATMLLLEEKFGLVNEVLDLFDFDEKRYKELVGLIRFSDYGDFVADREDLETILKVCRVDSEHMAEFEFIDASKIENIKIEGTGKRAGDKVREELRYEAEYLKWLELRHTERTAKNIKNRVKCLNDIIKIEYLDTYTQELNENAWFNEHTDEYKKALVRAVKSYFEFLEYGTKTEVPKHYEEFKSWLKNDNYYAAETKKGFRKNVRKAHKILSLDDFSYEEYIDLLVEDKAYKRLYKTRQSAVKVGVKVYFKFLDEKSKRP